MVSNLEPSDTCSLCLSFYKIIAIEHLIYSWKGARINKEKYEMLCYFIEPNMEIRLKGLLLEVLLLNIIILYEVFYFYTIFL